MSVVGTITVGRLKHRLARINAIAGGVLIAISGTFALLTSLANAHPNFGFVALWLGAVTLLSGCVGLIALGRAMDYWERGL